MTTPTTTPLALTDAQLTAVYQAAGPLEPRDRASFLEALAGVLRGRNEIGDGELHQAIRETQRQFVTRLRVHANWHCDA